MTFKVNSNNLVMINERHINILQRALNECFEVDESMTIEDAVIAAEEYLTEECPVDKYEECPIEANSFGYYDGKGYEKSMTGEFYSHRQTKFRFNKKGDPEPVEYYEDGYDQAYYFYEKVVNTDAEIVQLYTR